MTTPLPQPDFLRPVARPGWLAWAWCGTGLLVLAASAADGLAAWQQRSQALARLDRSAVAQARVPVPAPGPALGASTTHGAKPARPADTQARQAEARRWLQQLAQPWPVVWAANESAPGGVQWLVFEHGSAGLRLSGLAADLAPAQAAADALRAQRQQTGAAWQGVLLASVERVPEGQRFELLARLAPPVAGAAP
jgi:hypothetical protein